MASINIYPIAVVLSDSTEITSSTVKLTWTTINDADFKNYTMFASTIQGSQGTVVATVTDKAVNSYVVTGLTPETAYYFTRVYDSGSLYSDSNVVSVKTASSIP